MKKNLNFKLIFIFTVGFMIFYKLFNILGNLPEVFSYGNIIYQILNNIFDIMNQLAIGVSGAIVFYYTNLFIVAKKEVDKYYDIRTDLYNLLTTCMGTLKELDYFKELKKLLIKENRNVFFSADIVTLVDIVNNSSFNGTEYEYEQAIKKYLPETYLFSLDNELRWFSHWIEYFKSHFKYVTYKNSKEKYDEIINVFEDLDICNDTLKDLGNDIDADLVSEKCENFIYFLQLLIQLLDDFENLIKYIKNTNIFKFINMMD